MKTEQVKAESWQAAFRLARRESRDGFKGFRIFALALALGVFAIAAVGSLSAAFLAGLEREQSRLLGGDVEISVTDTVLPEDVFAWLSERGTLSQTTDAQLMVHTQDRSARSVVQLKAVDEAYPLLGTFDLSGGQSAAQALGPVEKNGSVIWGAVADKKLFDKLGLTPGGRITLGAAVFELRAEIEEEPDRAGAGFLISPRLMVSAAGAEATQLLARSGLVRRSVRTLLDEAYKEDFRENFATAFPDNGWRVRTADDAARGLRRTLDNLDVFLIMVGLAALVIGGVGAANAVQAYIQRKIPVIATLKCLGATGDFIMKTYALQVLMVSFFAVFCGLIAGAVTPFVVVSLAGTLLPFDASLGVYPVALVKAAGFGFLASLTFALWPLAKARQAVPAQLFRDMVEDNLVRPAKRDLILIGVLAVSFFALAILLSKERMFAFWFAISGFVVYGALRLVAWGIVVCVRRFWKPSRPAFRLAAASLTRPGAATASVTVSIGLGLTLLATISLIDANLSREIRSAIPDRAPGLFFSDIPFGSQEQFDALIAQTAPDSDYERYPMLRSGVRLLNGQPLSSVEGAAQSGWARQNDWGVTSLPHVPEKLGKITAGERWPADYQGPPLISLSDWQAKRFKLDVGDTITLTIAGRDVTATIKTLHDVNWDRDGINFIAVFAPGTLEAARPTSIGSLRTKNSDEEEAVVDALVATYPDVTLIRTRDVTASIAEIIGAIGLVIRMLSAVTLAAGVIVLLGAVAADFRRKLHDAMVMKTLGAGRGRILASFGVEYALLGLAPAIASLGLGMLGSWFVVARQMELGWQPTAHILMMIVFGATAVTFLIGMGAAWQALGTRPWPVLRSD